ncbi:MAG: hypothetical protein ABSB69_20375, partial [Solirubrobacteraceae bacterium]
MPQPAATAQLDTATDGPASGGRPEISELAQVGALSLALVGYVYVIGWLVTCVRLAAVRLSIAAALPSIDNGVIFATGARAVLVMAIVFAAMCAFAYAVHWRRWDRH